MTIFSDDCLGGFIYRDLLKQEYESPFIWTRMFTKTFVKFCKKIKDVNFDNVILDKTGISLSNNFYIKIDNEFDLHFHHVHFDAECSVPNIKQSYNSVDVHYNKPWEYILTSYKKRAKRINIKDNYVLCFNDIDGRITDEEKKELFALTNDKNVYLIIVSKTIPFMPNDKTLFLKCDDTWRYGIDGWKTNLLNNCGNAILEFINRIK